MLRDARLASSPYQDSLDIITKKLTNRLYNFSGGPYLLMISSFLVAFWRLVSSTMWTQPVMKP